MRLAETREIKISDGEFDCKESTIQLIVHTTDEAERVLWHNMNKEPLDQVKNVFTIDVTKTTAIVNQALS